MRSMFTVTTRDGTLETLELKDEASRSLARFAPARGGLLTRLSLLGNHLFFLDESTLRDTTKNVRGGNPVLFPSPGKLENDAWSYQGKKGALKQHGFARNLAWQVVTDLAKPMKDDARVTLRLDSSDETRAAFPWDFRAEYTYILKGNLLRIEQRFENTTSSHSMPMPFGAGFHPYFHVRQADKAGSKIGTPAKRAFDNVTKKTIDLPDTGIDLTQAEVDLHLEDHGTGPCTLSLPARTITLRGSPEFSRWVVWTVAGKDFVCVEPWTCPGNALNSGKGLLTLAPGQSKTLFVEYQAG
jgi:galactose mutarotase-like enzyme